MYRSPPKTLRGTAWWYLSLLWFLATAVEAQQPRQGSPQWYPRKDWSPGEHADYYRWREGVLAKQRSRQDTHQLLRRQKAIMNGNKITTEIWNYGSISSPGNRVSDIIWEGLGYGYEFGPFIGAIVEVPAGSHRDAYIKTDPSGNPVLDTEGDTVWVARVISDGLVSLGGEVSPDGKTFWGWEPLAYNDQGVPYADPVSNNIPTSNDIDRDGDGKPDSWPEGWYNPNLKRYVWPGSLRQGSSNADLEAFFVVDDRNNLEFDYYPFPEDSSRQGLGLEIEFRYYQWANPLAEDIVFLIYKVTNKSDKDLEEVIFGMWGDPHIGGPSNYVDDLSYFDRDLNMVYAWDEDGLSDVAGRPPGYFGYIFLESPGDPHDGTDNDGDGMVDEDRENGLDDDGDWDPEKDDVGVDGLPNTGDQGEGDGLPSAGDPFDIRQPGEPNFEWTDLDESDMIGLTSFAAPSFGGDNTISYDDHIYRDFITPGNFDSLNAEVAGDNIFLYGSGTFSLKAGEARRFSIALLVGSNFDDLTLNALTARDIYETNYQFAKPPEKPYLTAVPGDQQVTLFWDDIAESSFDPISEEYDFEGYVIYRSTDPQFLDQQNITDVNGSRFLFEPLKTATGGWAKFDLDNEFIGPSDIPYTGRGVSYYLGNNTGLRHTFIDSNRVINGQTYYYAVVSYDHGTQVLNIGPSECSKAITLNPETNEVFLDVNTARIVPRAPAVGYTPGRLEDDEVANGFAHDQGFATGDLEIVILDPRALEEQNRFEITFQESPIRYTVEDLKPVRETKTVKENVYIRLKQTRLNGASLVLTTSTGEILAVGVDYLLFPEAGQVLFPDTLSGRLKEGDPFSVEYTYYTLWESWLVNREESNPIFDGLQLFVQGKTLDLDLEKTGWSTTSQSNYIPNIQPYDGVAANKFPADYEIRFADEVADTSALGTATANFQVWDVTPGRIPTKQRIAVLDYSNRNGQWDPGEDVVILAGETGINVTWQFSFLKPSQGSTQAPGAGDVFYIATSRPFKSNDVYSFTTRASHIDQSRASAELEQIAVVPNPYVVTNVLEPLDRQNPRDRGPRKLYFNHLPLQCTIRIYTLTGELVDVLEHQSPINDGVEFWDLTTRDNFPIAYGVYIYHVEAAGLGEKIGRFAVIK